MTLTQVAVWTKRVIFISIFLIIVSLSTIIGLDFYRAYQISRIPPPVEKAEMKFGKLPDLSFPEASASSSNFSYSIDTTTGTLPSVPKFVKVFFIPQAGISLLSSQKAQDIAQSLGFNNGPTILSTTQQKFTDNNNDSFIINLATGNFGYQSSPATTSAQLGSLDLSNQTQIIQNFKNFLSNKNLLPPDLSSGRGNLVYNLDSNQATSSAEVSIWPNDINSLPVITSSDLIGPINAQFDLITSDPNTNPYFSMNYTYWPVDLTTSSTYPAKTADQGLKDLKDGNGFVIEVPSNPQVSITNLYLAYYEGNSYSSYLQPVLVFEGPGFKAIVPAVVNPP